MDKRTKEYKEYKMLNINKVVFHCICCNRDFVGEKESMPETCPICKTKDCIVINNSLVINK